MGYSSSYKGFRCLDLTTSRLYITRHTQFDDNYFPSLDTSQARPISFLQFSNFLEPSLPYTDMPPFNPEPHSVHIAQSGSSPYVLCIDPVDESLQVGDSLAGPSFQHSDPSSASLVPIELPPAAPVAAIPMSSHHMLT